MLEPRKEIREIAESRPLARTSHKCSVCGLPIAIGTRYQRILYRDNTSLRRDVRVIKWHLPRCPDGGHS